MNHLKNYKQYLHGMVLYHLTKIQASTDPYEAQNCKQQYFAFRQALDEFEHVLSVVGVDNGRL